MKKTIFLSFLCLASSYSIANAQTVTAQLQPAMVGGTPRFSTLWSEKNKVGFVQMGLVWTVFDPAVHGHGFKFTSEPVTAVSPILSQSCQIKSVKGSFNYIAGANGPHNALVINLVGDCAADITNFETNDIYLNFKNVPSLDGSVITPDLDVVITH